MLLLHLQAAFALEPQEIALLFLPGAIVLVVVPERAYELGDLAGACSLHDVLPGCGGTVYRGVGLYETVALLGAAIASPVLAAVYGGPGWRIACAIAAAGFMLGAALVPLVVRMLGLSDRLAPTTDTDRPCESGPSAS